MKKAKSQVIYFGGSAASDQDFLSLENLDLDKLSFIEFDQLFGMWLGIVWAHSPEVPVEPNELARFDRESLIPVFRDYAAAHGLTALNRGLSVEENWILFQLTMRKPYMCVLSNAQPKQPLGSVTHKSMMHPTEITQLMRQAFDYDGIQSTMVYDGQTGHVIALSGFDDAAGVFEYIDPWPGRSLLCAENNVAGVQAVPGPSGGRRWAITPEEFERVVFAVLMTMDLWEMIAEYS